MIKYTVFIRHVRVVTEINLRLVQAKQKQIIVYILDSQ